MVHAYIIFSRSVWLIIGKKFILSSKGQSLLDYVKKKKKFPNWNSLIDYFELFFGVRNQLKLGTLFP